jgi:hypothetical protein
MRITAFWDVAQCRSGENLCIGGTCPLHLQIIKNLGARNSVNSLLASSSQVDSFYLDDGGGTFLRNVASHKTYKTPQPIIRHS